MFNGPTFPEIRLPSPDKVNNYVKDINRKYADLDIDSITNLRTWVGRNCIIQLIRLINGKALQAQNDYFVSKFH